MVELTREIRGARIPVTAARGVVRASSNDWLRAFSFKKDIAQDKINAPHVSLLSTEESHSPGIIRTSPLLHLGLMKVKFDLTIGKGCTYVSCQVLGLT